MMVPQQQEKKAIRLVFAFSELKRKKERREKIVLLVYLDILYISNKSLLELVNNSDCKLICHRHCMLVQGVECSHISGIVTCEPSNSFCLCERQMFIYHIHHIFF